MNAVFAALIAAPAWHYAISLDQDLATITTTVCVDRGPIPALETNASFADAWQLGKPIAVGPSCVRSRAALSRAARKERVHLRAGAVGRDFIISPDLFMLVPDDGFDDDTKITAQFSTPPGISVLVPWRRSASGEYIVPQTNFDWRTLIAVGRFPAEKIALGGFSLDVAVLDAPMRASREGLRKWLSEAMRAVLQLYGEAPVPRAAVIIDPVPYGHGINFGIVYRGGGPTAMFLLGADAEDKDLPGEWTAVHELSHLFLPFVERQQAWLSEGIATYYQNILRARAGQLSAEEAWQEMHEGLERGKKDESDETLAEISAGMRENHRFMRIYWSGTAIALLADVELRAGSKNAKSLDSTLRALRDCCVDDGHDWTLAEIEAKLDAASGSKVFSTLFKKHLFSKSFPDLSDTYKQLGVVVEHGRVRFDDRAPLAWVRQAMVRAR